MPVKRKKTENKTITITTTTTKTPLFFSNRISQFMWEREEFKIVNTSPEPAKRIRSPGPPAADV